MAGTIRPELITPFGPSGPTWYLSTDNNPPSHAGDGNFNVGDRIINIAPAAGGTAEWICTAAGTGATATFKAVAISA